MLSQKAPGKVDLIESGSSKPASGCSDVRMVEIYYMTKFSLLTSLPRVGCTASANQGFTGVYRDGMPVAMACVTSLWCLSAMPTHMYNDTCDRYARSMATLMMRRHAGDHCCCR